MKARVRKGMLVADDAIAKTSSKVKKVAKPY